MNAGESAYELFNAIHPPESIGCRFPADSEFWTQKHRLHSLFSHLGGHASLGDYHSSLWIATTGCVITLLDCVVIALQTVPTVFVNSKSTVALDSLDTLFGTIMLCEWCGRVLTAPTRYQPLWKIALRPLSLLELCTYLPALFSPWVRWHSALHRGWGYLCTILSAFRVLRIFRYSERLQRAVLAIQLSTIAFYLHLVLVGINLLVFSSAVFYGDTIPLSTWDNTRQLWVRKDEGTPAYFQSVPGALWWTVVTITTTGFGDEYPTTTFGRVIGSLCMLSNFVLFALPTAILLYAEEQAKGVMDLLAEKRQHYRETKFAGIVEPEIHHSNSPARTATNVSLEGWQQVVHKIRLKLSSRATPSPVNNINTAAPVDINGTNHTLPSDTTTPDSTPLYPTTDRMVDEGGTKLRTVFSWEHRIVRSINAVLVTFIVLSCLCMAVRTLPSVHANDYGWRNSGWGISVLYFVEFCAVVLLVVDFGVNSVYLYGVHRRSPVQVLCSPYWWIDCIATVPCIAEFLLYIFGDYLADWTQVGNDPNAAPVWTQLTFVLYFRILKVLKHSSVLSSVILGLQGVLTAFMMVSAIITCYLMIFGTLLWSAETSACIFDKFTVSWICTIHQDTNIHLPLYNSTHYSQPAPIQSVPNAWWLVVVSSTTTGYGDVVPATALGKLVLSVCMLSAALWFAFPIALILDAFPKKIPKKNNHSAENIVKKNDDLQLTSHSSSSQSGSLKLMTNTNMSHETAIVNRNGTENTPLLFSGGIGDTDPPKTGGYHTQGRHPILPFTFCCLIFFFGVICGMLLKT